MKWLTHAELNNETVRLKKDHILVQIDKETINISPSHVEKTSSRPNILSIIKKKTKKQKKKVLVFQTERKYQAIINSFKLVVKDKNLQNNKSSYNNRKR